MPIGIDMNNYDISMGSGVIRVRGGGLQGNVFVNGNVSMNGRIDTQNYDISMGTGRVTFGAGGGLQGNVFVNGNVSMNGRIDTQNYDISMGSGVIRVRGGGLQGNVYINGNLFVGRGATDDLTGAPALVAGTWVPLNGASTPNPELVFKTFRVGTFTVQNSTSFGITHGSFDTGVNAAAKVNFVLSGNPNILNNWGGNPNVNVMTLQINNSGASQVGINTANPTAALDVSGTVRVGGGAIINYGTNTLGFGFGGSTDFRWKIDDVAYNRGTSNPFDYGTQSKLIFSCKLTNTFSGGDDSLYRVGLCLAPLFPGNGAIGGVNVGIGKDNPAYTLDVSGGSINLSGPSFESNVTNVDNFTNSSIIISTSGTGTANSKSFIGSRTLGGGGGVGFVFSRNSTWGTQVQVYTNDATTTIGALSTGGPLVAPGATAWSSPSDERLKDNITELPDDTLDIISNIHAVNFTWKNNTSNKKCIGFIAQNVQEYYPEVVNNSSTGYLVVEYTSMIPVLLKSIQQLKTKLDDALQRIQTLESK